MLVRTVVGNRKGEIQEMRYDDALRCFQAGTAQRLTEDEIRRHLTGEPYQEPRVQPIFEADIEFKPVKRGRGRPRKDEKLPGVRSSRRR